MIYLQRKELQKKFKFTCYYEYVTFNGSHYVIHDAKEEEVEMSILDALLLYKKSLKKTWRADFFRGHAGNCELFIDGNINTDGTTWASAYVGFQKSHKNHHFEFIIATLGEPEEDDCTPLENIHYVQEGKALKLSSDFEIARK